MLLQIEGLRLGYGHSTSALIADLNLCVGESGVVSVVGPNASGKSSLLKRIAQFGLPSSFWLTSNVFSTPDVASLGYVPQVYTNTVFDWLSGVENILFPRYLQIRSWSRAHDESADSLFEIQKVFANRLPLHKKADQMSGGELQCVVVAREMLISQKLLLLDEAFSAIDHNRRRKVIDGVREFAKTRKLAVLSVSHNVDEAVVLSDQVLVLSTSRDVSHQLIRVKRNDLSESISRCYEAVSRGAAML